MRQSRYFSAALLTVVAAQAQAFDTYNTQSQQLSIPAVTIGNATFTNMVVGVGLADIVVAPNGNSANTSVDTYNPLNNQLTIPTVTVGSKTYYNVVVAVGNLVSIGAVSGADTYDAGLGEVMIPAVQVGNTIYNNALITVGSIQSHGGGMPQNSLDVYNASSHQLTIAAIQVGNTVFTNALITPGSIRGVGGQQSVESVFYSFGPYTGVSSDSEEPLNGLILGIDGNFYGTASLGGGHGAGTVFKVTPAGIESIVYAFGDNGAGDCKLPAGNLVQGGDGTLYGTSLLGGSSGQGAVFKVTPQGVESVLYSFTGGNDGGGPESTLVLDGDGNLYGTASGGGTHNDGTIFKLTPQGTETVLWSFSGAADGQGPVAGLTPGNDGYYYGTTFKGGAHGAGTAYKIPVGGGTLTVLHTFGSSGSDGAFIYAGLTLGHDGNLYGVAINDENATGGTVFKLTRGGALTTVYEFTGAATTDGANPYGNLIEDANGNFYGTTLEGGLYHQGTVFKITPAGTEVQLHSFSGEVSGSTDGMGPDGNLVFGANGDLYGLTSGGGVNDLGAVFQLIP